MKEFDYVLLAKKYAGYFILLQNTKISITSLRKLKFIHGNDFKVVFERCLPLIEAQLKERGFSLIKIKGLTNGINFICQKT